MARSSAADDLHFTDAGRAFELDLDDLVRDLGQFAHASGWPRGQWSGSAIDRCRTWTIDGRIGVARQIPQHGGDAVAHVLGCGYRCRDSDSNVTMTNECAQPVDRAEFIDAFNRVDGFLDRLGNLRLHLRRRRARQPGVNRTVGRSTEGNDPRPGANSPPRRRRPGARTIIAAKTGRRMQISASFCTKGQWSVVRRQLYGSAAILAAAGWNGAITVRDWALLSASGLQRPGWPRFEKWDISRCSPP